MGKMSVKGLVVGAVLALSGCAHHVRTAPEVAADDTYRIGRDDILDVVVWRDNDLTKTLPVRPDGMIAVPLVGEVKAEGKTPNELADELKSKLGAYIQEPKVTVMVHEVNSRNIFVTGEVAKPGVFALKGRVSVLQAIALAGGFNAFANQDGILVIRQGKNGGRIPVRYSDLISDDTSSQKDFPLQPGDTIVVP